MATEKDIEHNITLELDGEITPKQLSDAVMALSSIVKSAHKTAGIDNLSLQIQVKKGSQLVEFFPQKDSCDIDYMTLENISAGINSFETDTKNSYGFSDSMLRNLLNLCNVAKLNSKNEHNKVKIWFYKKPLEITKNMQENLELILGGIFTEHGSIEGRLLVLDKQGEKNQFAITEPLHFRKIKCTTSDNPVFDDAYKFFGKRIEAEGMIRYDKNGLPSEICVDFIRPLPTDEELPDYKLTRGILKQYA